MKKLLITSGLLAAVSAQADVFTVDVEVQTSVGTVPLTIQQTQPMQYPVLTVDDATEVGAICRPGPNTTGYDVQPATNVNSLCPNQNGQQATATITGTPNASITVTLTVPEQTAPGLAFGQFGTNGTAVRSRTLSAAGTAESGTVGANITLTDRDAIIAGTYQFTYEIQAAYE